jgi:hypothetical protein
MVSNTLKDSLLKILAVVGAITILSIGGLVVIVSLKNLPSLVSNLRAQAVSITQRFVPDEKIIVSLDNLYPKNNHKLNLSFEHIEKEDNGSYFFFYECRQGVYLERVLGSNREEVFCNNPYNFINKDNSLSLVLYAPKDELIEVPLSINYVKNNSNKVSKRGQVSIFINGEEIIESEEISEDDKITNSDNNKSNKTSSKIEKNEVERKAGEKAEELLVFNETGNSENKFIPDPNGLADLRPEILEIGYIDRVTNIFTATSTIPFSKRGAVKFIVENKGSKSTGAWTFNVVLPTVPSYVYQSKLQQALLPGDRIEYIIGFDSAGGSGGSNVITVSVDPTNSVSESDEKNNIIKGEFAIYSSN